MIKFLPKASLRFLWMYNESSEFVNANENDVASSPNLEDIC
jgi:hypothetical protein